MTRRRVKPAQARRLGRPKGAKGRAHIVLGPRGSAYEVLDVPSGVRRVFALELRYVEPGSDEYEAVVGALDEKLVGGAHA